MKRILLALFIISWSFLAPTTSKASHGMGGELTWTCQANGQFKFKLKFYRDCSGIPAPASISLTTTHPSVTSIPMPRTQQNDISPKGLVAAGNAACPACASATPNIGLVEEDVYESAPVTLSGVPPATGWTFYWGECCRSGSINNISNPGSIGFRIRAVMYPYNGQNTNPCFDSSPYFAEKPSTIICTGYPFKYNPNAIDPELDSLRYEWGTPLDDAGAAAPWAPGYNVNSQLPSTTQNINNIGATINATTGEISYTSFTGGYFATVVKVTAYKCNVKVAEIFREINVVLNSNCPTTGGQQNLPPDVAPPFQDPATGLFTSYIDTVYAGDTVRFQFSALDFQTFNNGTPQTVTIEASGSEFGTNFTNPNSGCIIAPCATLSPAAPTALNPYQVATGQFAALTNFNWVTTCQHVEGLDTNCRRIINSYNFVIKARDNYCPANASAIKTITIVIVRPPKLDPPVLRCASVNLDGSVTLTWNKSTARDTQNIWHSYEIWASPVSSPPNSPSWVLVDSVKFGFLNPLSYSYTHSAASLQALFGTNAQQQSIYYYIKTRSGCNADSISNPSNVLQTIKLNAVLNAGNADLTWNALASPPLSSHAGNKYMIYREFPAGTWTLIDSTLNLNYSDPFPQTQCNANIVYKVSLSDSSGCISWSSLDTIIVNNPNPNVVITPLNPVICQGSSVTLNCSTVGNTYLWNNGQVTQSITVNNTGTYTVTVTVAGGCSGTGSTTVTVSSPPAPTITGNNIICAGTTTTFNAGAGFASYQWSGGLGNTQTVSPTVSGTYTVTVTNASGCSGTSTRTLTVNPNPVPAITGNNVICAGGTTTFNAGPGYTGYQWSSGLGNSQNASPSSSGTYTVTVTDANGCTGTASRTLTVNPNPVPVITGNNVICAGATTSFNAGAGYTNYQWSGGLGTAQSVNPAAAGTYTVTVTDANGCTGTGTRTLTINPNPVPVITGTNVICSGSSTTFNAGAYASYQWSSGLGTAQTASVSTAGTYTVTVTDANGCTGTATRALTVNANPVPSITGNNIICAGSSTTFNAGAYNSYQWSAGLGTAQTAVVNTSGTYTVTVTDANGCTGTASRTLTVNANPVPVITGTNVLCTGSTTTFDAGSGYTSYQWSAGLGSGQTASPLTAGTYTVTVTDANGCTGTGTRTLTINANPVPAITGNNVICAGSSATFNAGSYASYQWSSGLGTSQTATVTAAGSYTVTVTDANGCTGTATRTLTVNANPVPAITGNNIICAGFSATFNAGIYNSYQWSAGLGTAQTAVVNTSGTYTVTVTDANGCTGTASRTLTVNANPAPVITGTNTLCAGASTIFDAGAGYVSYLWSGGLGSSQTASPLTSGTYTVTVTDANGCVGSSSRTLTINPNPVAVITGTFTACQGTNTTLTANPGMSSYQWTGGLSTTTINPGIAGTYTVTITDANGCTGTTSQIVTINANPVPAVTGNNVVCAGFSATFSASAGFPGYQWAGGLGATQSITVSTAGSYTVTVTDANGCTGTATRTLTVNPNPVPVITGTNVICAGTSTSFNAGAGYSAYQWSGGLGTSQSVVPVLAGTYTVTVTDANGCIGSASQTLTINSNPVAAITGDFDACQGSTATLNANPGMTTYAWSNGQGTATINPGTAGPYTVTITDGNGCTGSTFQDVTIHPNPVPVISGSFVVCQGFAAQLDATPGFAGYLWNGGASTASISPTTNGTYTVTVTDLNTCSGSVSQVVTVNPNPTPVISGTSVVCDGTTTTFDAGIYSNYSWSDGSSGSSITTGTAGTYTVTVTDANGCIGSTSQTLTVNAIPTGSVNGTAPICIGDQTLLYFNFTGTGPFNFTYTDGSSTFGPFSSSTVTTDQSVSPVTSTTYTLVSLNDANCPGTLSGTVNITVNPLPTPAISGDLEVCDGETSMLSANTGYVNYIWSTGDATPDLIVNTGGAYTVTVTDDNGCINSTQATFIVNQTPVAEFTHVASSDCETPRTIFSNTSTYPPASQFTWTFGDGSTSTQTNPVHIYNDQGTYDATLYIMTSAGCADTVTHQVDVIFYPLAEADFKFDPEFVNVFNGQVNFTDLSTNAVAWNWEFGDFSSTTVQNPSHYFNDVGDFLVTLTVFNINGCPDKISKPVMVAPFYIPNAFTPNGDGVNDVFFNAGYELDISSFEMTIYNRWGQPVYVSDSYLKFWDGTNPDKNPAPEGVYAYTIKVVTLGGKEHTFRGTTTLVR